MSLKELTAEKHKEAESTKFMKAVFAKTLPIDLWKDWTYQKSLFYNGIEGVAGACGLTQSLPDIQRAHYLYLDYRDMLTDGNHSFYKQKVVDYYQYILKLLPEPDKVMAHLYVWHMGDLFGGQMIKKIINAPSRSLDFKNPELLKQSIREKLKVEMAAEANIAFDWAISMMREYDRDLEQN